MNRNQIVMLSLLVASGGLLATIGICCGGCMMVAVDPPRMQPIAAAAPKEAAGDQNQLTPDEQLCLRAYAANELHVLDSSSKIGAVGSLDVVEVFQVTSSSSFIGKRLGLGLFFVEGVATRDFVDGKRYDFSAELFLIEGTRRYQTALGGTNQVLVFRKISTPRVLKTIAKKYAESKGLDSSGLDQ